jgi:hypothetical protein
MGIGSTDRLGDRLRAEASALVNFCVIADRQGLSVPGYHTIRELLQRQTTTPHADILMKWPLPDALPALGLAQHNGIPTCLLDFTRDPYIAAYFAAKDAVESQSQEGSLCVWAVNDGTLVVAHRNTTHPLRLVVPPASDNQTLQRQQGVFVYSPLAAKDAEILNSPFVPPRPFEEYWRSSREARLTKITLQNSFANELLRNLIKLGYESARFFPSYSGVAKSVLEYDSTRTGLMF